jgi:hypothetical protein
MHGSMNLKLSLEFWRCVIVNYPALRHNDPNKLTEFFQVDSVTIVTLLV